MSVICRLLRVSGAGFYHWDDRWWAMEARLNSQLVLGALQMAYAQRCPDEVIHHSDHGTEYTAVAFSTRCRELGITRSMGSVGDCFDNAMMESFFSSLEAEVLDRYHFQTRDEARREIFLLDRAVV